MAADLAASDVEFAGLSDEERQQVESWLVEFDQGWDKDSLAAWLRKLPPQGDRLRRSTLVEMVKIDIERRWLHGRRSSLESYLKALPELGTPETVPPELILAEYEARLQHGGPADLEDFAQRFPRQINQVKQLLAIARDESALCSKDPRSGTAEKEGPAGPALEGLPHAESSAPSGRLGRYQIIRRLGKGSMGSVYLARDGRLDRLVALKKPHFDPDDEELEQRFRREALAAAKIDHPNLCRVYDVEQVDGTLVLTMEYIEGKPMSELIKHDKPLSQRQIAHFIRKLALALQEAHARGVIHRDLKPANIMVTRSRGPVIVDFGLARRFDRDEVRLTKSNALLGTPAYMPPERTDSAASELCTGCDVYSLGVIMYELLAGRLPFQGSVMEVLAKIATQSPVPPREFRPDLDPRLEAICLKAMAKKPQDRFATMTEFALALRGWLMETQPAFSSSQSHSRASTGRPSSEFSLENQFLAGLVFDDESTVIDSVKPLLASGWLFKRPRRIWLGLGGAAAALVVALGIVITIYHKDGTKTVIKVPDGATVEITKEELPQPASPRQQAPQHEGQDQPSKPAAALEVHQGPQPPVVAGEPHPAAAQPPKHSEAARRLQPDEKGIITNSIGMNLTLIPKGEFWMGATDSDREAPDVEKPRHRARITKPFYLGVCEVTRGQFQRFVDETRYQTEAEKDGKGGWGWNEDTKKNEQNPRFTWRSPGFGQTAEHPVVQVSWNDAAAFAEWLSRVDGRPYRLPTEAEWEYACRAGTTTTYSSGDDPESLARVGNVADGTAKARHPDWITIAAPDGYEHTAPVGRFQSNAFGLYDMHGNVHEWCRDVYAADYFKQSPVDDPPGASGALSRVIRGGSWEDRPRYVRSSWRSGCTPSDRFRNVGFRLATTPDAVAKSSAPESRLLHRNNLEPAEKAMTTNSIGMKLALVSAGDFWMGSADDDRDAMPPEKPRHRVRISRPFYLGIHEVTQAEYKVVVGNNPSQFAPGGASQAQVAGQSTKRFPVESVSWFDAVQLCNRLSEREKLRPCYRISKEEVELLDGSGYRLPTEAEWEYACRGGSSGAFCFGNDVSLLSKYSWFGKDENGSTPSPVMASQQEGPRLPNAFGLFDMHGNLLEWCWDWYDSRYYASLKPSSEANPIVDPLGPDRPESDGRVIRGGSWWTNYKFTRKTNIQWNRSACRLAWPPSIRGYSIGFRVARTNSPEPRG
jgi:formylglycine-generating enzyme required for sulfatase activity/serine/threonine protein kinase